MKQVLPREPECRQRYSIAPASGAPVSMEPAPLPVHVMDETSIWQRLRVARMSDAERRAAVDALLLGRDIGRALLRVQRLVSRWMGGGTGWRHVRRASWRNAHMLGRTSYRASHPGHAPTGRLK